MLLRPELSVLPAALRATMPPRGVSEGAREPDHAVSAVGKAD